MSLALRARAFLLLADALRALPAVRGKVRLGLSAYRRLGLEGQQIGVERPLFREGLPFLLNLASAHERMALLMNGYEDEVADFLAGLYSGGYILDIGANIGLVAIPLALRTEGARAGRRGHLVAFEAMPSNYTALRANTLRNGLEDRITSHCLGLGAGSARTFIEIEGGDGSRTGTANMLPPHLAGRGQQIEIVSLDALRSTARLPKPVTLVKLDTDGYDLEILKGARTLLAEDRPLLFAELNAVCLGWHGQTLGDAVHFLDAHGYETWPCSSRRPMRFRAYRPDDAYQMDCLLVPRERASELQRLRSDV